MKCNLADKVSLPILFIYPAIKLGLKARLVRETGMSCLFSENCHRIK